MPAQTLTGVQSRVGQHDMGASGLLRVDHAHAVILAARACSRVRWPLRAAEPVREHGCVSVRAEL
eukprot:3408892-Rhodomonas_salina.1